MLYRLNLQLLHDRINFPSSAAFIHIKSRDTADLNRAAVFLEFGQICLHNGFHHLISKDLFLSQIHHFLLSLYILDSAVRKINFYRVAARSREGFQISVVESLLKLFCSGSHISGDATDRRAETFSM